MDGAMCPLCGISPCTIFHDCLSRSRRLVLCRQLRQHICCACVRVAAWTMCQKEIDCTIAFVACRQSVSCEATDSNFPALLSQCVCVCGWCFVPNENMQLFVVLYHTFAHQKGALAHTITRVVDGWLGRRYCAHCVYSKRTKIVYSWWWWCHSVVSTGDNESPSHHLNKLALCHRLLPHTHTRAHTHTLAPSLAAIGRCGPAL